jgi:hypothetical protein
MKPTMMRYGAQMGWRYSLPSKRVVLVGRIEGDLVHCTYIDDGLPVDFDLDWLETWGKRA